MEKGRQIAEPHPQVPGSSTAMDMDAHCMMDPHSVQAFGRIWNHGTVFPPPWQPGLPPPRVRYLPRYFFFCRAALRPVIINSPKISRYHAAFYSTESCCRRVPPRTCAGINATVLMFVVIAARVPCVAQ